ncbi:MAG: hypothetical protein K8I60_09185, partial [Anaerolineae bacterium]|nr:hypothetical protein [Anaerolineae bacterium]
MHSRHIYKWWWLAGLVILLLMMAAFPLAAQQNPPGFATNTPVPPPLAFATNTPQPLLNPVIQVPSAPLERYALRRWDEASLVNILLEQVRRLQPGETERALVIRILQLELERRFPGAPRHAEQRESLLRAMLAAPRGSVDMRAVIRPFITGQLNTEHPTLDSTSTLTAAGFALTIMPMNLDGVEPLDALVHIIYPADAATSDDVLYEDYVPAQQNG